MMKLRNVLVQESKTKDNLKQGVLEVTLCIKVSTNSLFQSNLMLLSPYCTTSWEQCREL